MTMLVLTVLLADSIEHLLRSPLTNRSPKLVHVLRLRSPMTRDDLPAPQQSTSQIEGSPPKPSPPPLRKSRTTSARLDALRNAYTAVTESTSQISVGELVQATTLVHRIGAALSEQMSKRFGKSD
ncbi:hypothetical protein EDD16DRAFT_1157200 [Pisolithus croceorrhizus]|nr:hypothetical protein EDD16DRAFT_1157200 [Pisolithus croceorrhizus]